MSTHRGSPSSSLTAALLAEADHHRKHPGGAGTAAAPANLGTSLPSAPSSNGEVFEPSSQPTVVGSPWGMGRGGGIFMRSAPSLGSLRRSLDLIMEQDTPEARQHLRRGRNSPARQHDISPDVEAGRARSSARARISMSAAQPLLQHAPSPADALAPPEPAGQKQEQAAALATKAREFTDAVVFGIINGIVGIPTMISFATIIYKDPAYSAYLGDLAKLGFFASGVHQAVFTLMSTLPYAVGQVQDVGLLFCSNMAASIAAIGLAAGASTPEIMGTALTWLAISTVFVGVCTMLVGRYKLATLVQYMPLPVVGAYLAYVGFFCIAAGVELGTGVNLADIKAWPGFAHEAVLLKLVPTIAATMALLLTMRYVHNSLALPMVLCLIPVSFHVVRVALGSSMADATTAGWLMPGQGSGAPFWSIYELFNWHFDGGLKIGGVMWSAMPRQIPQLIGLFAVVAFGSSLDVAAIQQDSPQPLDFNAELLTVGTSNVVAGALGAGMTGSYIFSQTIFSMRGGVTNRIHGAIISAMELALFFLPFSVVEYMPKFFYGSLLFYFGVEISMDWLVHSAAKLTRAEYLLLWCGFFSILFLGLEGGIAAGVVLSALYFATAYARANVQSFKVMPSRSGTMRPWDQRIILDVFTNHTCAVSLSGYIFFGSAIAISDKLVAAAQAMLAEDAATMTESGALSTLRAGRRVGSSGALVEDGKLPLEQRAKSAVAESPRFVVLDFRRMRGLDATAARSFGTLASSLGIMGVQMLVTHLDPDTETARLLAAHGVTLRRVNDPVSAGAFIAFDSLHDGMLYCEQQYLQVAARHGLCHLNPKSMSLAEILRSHMEEPATLFTERVNVDRAVRDLERVTHHKSLLPGDKLFGLEDPSMELFLIESGSINLRVSFLHLAEDEREVGIPETMHYDAPVRTFEYGPGAILGQADFFLQRPRTGEATCGLACKLRVVPRSAFDTLRRSAPEALIVLQAVMLRSVCFEESHALETLERSGQ